RFSSWNLPYAAYCKALGQRPGEPSPFGGGTGATPTCLNIASPEAATPGRSATGPSPAMQLVRQKVAQDRSSLFLQGRHQELLASCGNEDRRTLTNYLHDFYIHSFVVAKYWGRGPRVGQWTLGLVSAITLGSFLDIGTPATLAPGTSPAVAHDGPHSLDSPTQLCRWSIHVPNIRYTQVAEPVVDVQDGFDIQDPRSWAEWPRDEAGHPASFARSMQEAITDSSFSLVPTDQLPIATESILQAVQRDEEQLQVDAWKVAIMAGNLELLDSLIDSPVPSGIDGIYPFHLAASFPDGGKTCCGVFRWLQHALGVMYHRRHEHDDLGQTVLDTFMIVILRSHTSVSPEHVSTRFNPPHRFPGEEQDICGRWDPVSPPVRTLFRHGYSRIPTSWKHAFCHSAAQAICHSLIAILAAPIRPPIDSPSGLFVRRCNNCGLELKLGPLHTLVVVAFYLAHRGMSGETMFGALAILVCLLSLGADASLMTMMSVEDILGQAEHGRCCHKLMDASDLLEAVPHDFVAQWTTDCQTGWRCIQQVLLLAKSAGDDVPQQDDASDSTSDSEQDVTSDGSSDSGREGCEGSNHGDQERVQFCRLCCPLENEEFGPLNLPCGGPKLGLLWATIQIELLTYRRINIGDPWISGRFSMDALKTWLEGGSLEFLTPLVESRMMKKHSCCGWFLGPDFVCPIAEEACKEYCMNMDDYDRGSFVPRPDHIDYWMECF
ncbi:hypothetical protein C8A05DRAFT_18446, partial [Staphylotrichum tortipilum]